MKLKIILSYILPDFIHFDKAILLYSIKFPENSSQIRSSLFYSSAEAQRIVQIDNAYKRLMAQLPEDARVKMLNNTIGNSKNIIKRIQLVRLNKVLYYAYLIPIGLAILNFVLIILDK